MLEASSTLEDSGFESPSRGPTFVHPPGFVPVPNPLAKLIAEGYEELYLCREGSLLHSYENGLPPPVKTSPERVASALALTPGSTRSVNAQLERVANFRNFGLINPPVVDLTSGI